MYERGYNLVTFDKIRMGGRLKLEEVWQADSEDPGNSFKCHQAHTAWFTALQSLDMLDAKLGTFCQLLLGEMMAIAEFLETVSEPQIDVFHATPMVAPPRIVDHHTYVLLHCHCLLA